MKKGFTLIEILIAVLLFVILVVLVLATLTRSSASSQKADELRSKTEVARNITNQIATDFQFTYLKGEKVNFYYKVGYVATGQLGYVVNPPMSGMVSLPSWIAVELQYPSNQVGNKPYVQKIYGIEAISGSEASAYLKYREGRDCSLAADSDNPPGKKLICDENSDKTDLIPSNYVLNLESDRKSNYDSYFDGINIVDGLGSDPKLPGAVKVQLTIKPFEYKDSPCSDTEKVPEGTCYTISTTLNAGLR